MKTELTKTVLVEPTKPTTKHIHKKHKLLKKLVEVGLPVILTGAAGTGKTHTAELVAKELGLDFYSLSVCGQSTKSDLLGYTDANGSIVSTSFLEAFKNGGIFLLDEMDAGNPNILLVLNSAIANKYCSFPEGKVHAHKNFRLIGSANSLGAVSDVGYVGRNTLDKATLNRFCTIVWELDLNLEEYLTDNARWYNFITESRKALINTSENDSITQRTTLNGATLLKEGLAIEDVVEVLITNSYKDRFNREIINKCCIKHYVNYVPPRKTVIGDSVILLDGEFKGEIATIIKIDNSKLTISLTKGRDTMMLAINSSRVKVIL